MEDQVDGFGQFGLRSELMQAIDEVGYEAPTPIQIKTIPLLLAGRDVIGQAQTGTGKTGAFALPILDRLDVGRREVQALVLTPTRELGIQVAEAFHTYGKRLGGVRTIPVYGGQPIGTQLARLRSGAHVVVGTPGRLMDHLRRGSLSLQSLTMVVLDEADEMLRMGFIEDVEWILSQAPEGVQKALFSATIPPEIRRIAERYLSQAVTIEVEHKTLTVPTVAQRYIVVTEPQKMEALSHVLETELDPGEAALVFARTKLGTGELAEKLQARGVDAEAMNGDLNQSQREAVIRRLRSGDLEVVIATDVAARGLDVDRIGLVINYDIPYDTESYVHRIGRTGRAGRAGKAVLFVTPPQRRMLREIERYTGQRIEAIQMPSRADVAARRITLFKERLLKLIDDQELDIYINLVEELAQESGREMAEIAAAAARLARGDTPLEVVVEPMQSKNVHTEQGMVRLFIDAGRESGVRPADIVGAIANEAGVPGNVIGAIDIYPRFSFVDVPAEYLDQVLTQMDGATIRSRDANLRIATAKEQARAGEPRGVKPHGKPRDWKPRGWKSGTDKRKKFKKPFG